MEQVTKKVWKFVAIGAAIVVAMIVALLVWCIGKAAYDEYHREVLCFDPDCVNAKFLSENVYYHSLDDGKGYVFNSQTREKTIKDIKWIARPNEGDSLVCFKQGEKRGYFNMNTGRVAIEPRYAHAWIFSEGLACVDDGGRLKFIDGMGKVTIDTKMAYVPEHDSYVFHQGYFITSTNDGEKMGLMNKNGSMVLPMEFDRIEWAHDFEYLCLRKGDEMGVLDKELKTVLPMMACDLEVTWETIDVTMADHTICKYDLQGNLINDFYIAELHTLEYEKDEVYYHHKKNEEYGEEYDEVVEGPFHPTGTARLRAYIAGNGHEGLITADGHVVTKPLYKEIEAIGYDLYLCSVTYYDKVIVNGKGELVR